MQTHSQEIKQGNRFEFGNNWRDYISTLTENKINKSKQDLCNLLKINNLSEKTFLDIGSGSGLSSLVARKLGAKVTSFDYDPNSVIATQNLKNTFFKNDALWHITEGSALDQDFLSSLGKFDIVYSWGVLHHTGDMYQAFENIAPLVAEHGMLVLAIYNDQGWISSYWKKIKQLYCKNKWFRPFIVAWHFPYPLVASVLLRLISGRLELNRGMNYWHDYLDWLGGHPFEVASPKNIEKYFKKYNFDLVNTNLTKRSGCSEFVFTKKST